MYSTYSFEDLACTLRHPSAGVFNLQGAGAGTITFAMTNDVTEHEVAAAIEGDAPDVRLLASRNDRYNTIFIINYNPQSAEDLTATLRFKAAREGVTKMRVYRVDEAMMWDDESFELIPTEDRIVYLHEDLHFSVYLPANGVVMVSFDYDV